MSRKKMLESFDKCVWDISIDKISLKDRPHVIDFIEHITGLKTLCGRLTNEPYRLIWVEDGYINGQAPHGRTDTDIFFKNALEPRGYRFTKIDCNIGGL